MAGTYRTEYTIVPQEVGNYTIPGVPLVYFDVESGEYKTVEVADKPIKVLRGSSAAPAVSQEAIDSSIDDILHIRRSDMSEQVADISYTVESPLYWFMYILAAAILVGVLCGIPPQHTPWRPTSWGASSPRQAAWPPSASRTRKRLWTLIATMNSMPLSPRLSGGYISDKLSISPSGLTRDNVADKLNAYGLSGEDADKVLEILDRCEMARFTPIHQMRRWPIYMQKPPKQSKALKT